MMIVSAGNERSETDSETERLSPPLYFHVILDVVSMSVCTVHIHGWMNECSYTFRSHILSCLFLNCICTYSLDE